MAQQIIKTDDITSSAITAAKIASATITDVQLATGAVTETKIATGAVTNGKIGSLAVDDTKISGVSGSKVSSAVNLSLATNYWNDYFTIPIVNADFTSGLTGWTIDSGSPISGSTIFGTMGSVQLPAGAEIHQTIVPGDIYADSTTQRYLNFSCLGCGSSDTAKVTLTCGAQTAFVTVGSNYRTVGGVRIPILPVNASISNITITIHGNSGVSLVTGCRLSISQ